MTLHSGRNPAGQGRAIRSNPFASQKNFLYYPLRGKEEEQKDYRAIDVGQGLPCEKKYWGPPPVGGFPIFFFSGHPPATPLSPRVPASFLFIAYVFYHRYSMYASVCAVRKEQSAYNRMSNIFSISYRRLFPSTAVPISFCKIHVPKSSFLFSGIDTVGRVCKNSIILSATSIA